MIYYKKIMRGDKMQKKVSKEELLHIANLADLNIKDDEVDEYLKNLDDILNYVEIIQNAPIDKLDETIGNTELSNVFRKDEPVEFDNKDGILSNATEMENNMFNIPKVIN